MYIEKAHPMIQKFAEVKGAEFIKEYESCADFREIVDAIMNMTFEQREQFQECAREIMKR